MKVLFTTWAWPSHLFPMVPLAWALRSAGHEVRIASGPELERTIRDAGLPAVAVGGPVDIAERHRELYQELLRTNPAATAARSAEEALKNFALFVEIAEAMSDDLVSFAKWWRPDVVVFDPFTYAGALAARIVGVPAVRHLFGPDVNFFSHRLELQAVAPMLERFGVDTLDLLGVLSVDPCPPSVQFQQFPNDVTRQRMRYVPYSGLSRVPGPVWTETGRKRVCLTWGTSTARLCGKEAFLAPSVLKSLAELDADVVVAVTASQRDLLGEAPDGVRVLYDAPLRSVLPGCDLVVHQGGAGTAMTAGLNAVPQLILPQLPDQITNADNLAAAGVARVLRPGQADAQAIEATARLLLTDAGHAGAARRLQAEILAQPTPAEVVGRLEQVARDGVPAGPAAPAPSAARVFGKSYLEYMASLQGSAVPNGHH
jgi:UDP:flavonoid glycosyltransferase YjiC (YdhE family)